MDELRRLDLLIHLEVLKQKSSRPDNPLEQFKGLVLTDEEIAGLLTETAGPQSGNSPAAPGEAELQQVNEELNRLTSQIRTRREASLKEGVYLSLPHLSELFNLTPFEEQCILITLAPELDRRYEKLYAYLQDDVTRKRPGVDLVLKLLCPSMQEKLAARPVFAPQAPLLKFGLVEMTGRAPEDFTPLLSRFIKLNDRIVNFLLISDELPPQLEHAARVVRPGQGPVRDITPD
ncbi:ATP-binding protein, partial [bacterium]